MDMIENFDHILLFKTNVRCHDDKQLLHTLFDNNIDIKCWSVDMEDEDCVLRIVSYTLNHSQIIKLINRLGYQCCELT
ncbi:hypothetical protein [Mucilaginibacter sp. AK015]|uniref:hypothetical protein n=1 Tax=Mucilaginibacter sp. AK015 TaxID=2723072 RepID=UPI0017CAA9C4|nr:hypothetical protein [Mucilaginibacter sp. AK015]MBB5397116.1 hypothetical protein [Mucilaginibacter sp. AK015]